MEPVRLETARLILELLGPGHAALLYPKLLDPRIYEFVPQEPPKSLEALESNYRARARGGSADGREIWLNWALIVQDNGDRIGRLEATIERLAAFASIAYFVCPNFNRKGYAREGCLLMIEHLLSDLSGSRLTSMRAMSPRSV